MTRQRYSTGPLTAALQIPQEETRCDCYLSRPHLYSAHIVLSLIYTGEDISLSLTGIFFLLNAVNYEEIN